MRFLSLWQNSHVFPKKVYFFVCCLFVYRMRTTQKVHSPWLHFPSTECPKELEAAILYCFSDFLLLIYRILALLYFFSIFIVYTQVHRIALVHRLRRLQLAQICVHNMVLWRVHITTHELHPLLKQRSRPQSRIRTHRDVDLWRHMERSSPIQTKLLHWHFHHRLRLISRDDRRVQRCSSRYWSRDD